MANAKIETSSEFKTEIVEVKKNVVVLTLSEDEASFLFKLIGGHTSSIVDGSDAPKTIYRALQDVPIKKSTLKLTGLVTTDRDKPTYVFDYFTSRYA